MSISHFKCTPREVREFIIQCIAAGLVPYVEGSPGIGKSSIVHQIGQDFDMELIDHRVSTSEPTDATGLPEFFDLQLGNASKRFARFVPFADLFPVEGMSIPLNAKGEQKNGWLLFLDELPSAPRQTQAAFYKLMLDRMVGQYKLHEKVAIVAAGNLTTDRAIVNAMGTAMQSRLVHLELQVSFEEWLEDVAFKHNYDQRIIAFLSQFPNKLMDFKPDHHDKTYCCPRTWEFVNRLLMVDPNITDKTAKLFTGTITSGVATEFIQFTKVYQDLVTIQEIRANPKSCRLPLETNLKWATITALAENIDNENFEDLTTYADRFDPSFRVLFYRSFLARKPKLRNHPKFGPTVAKMAKYLERD